MKYSTLSFILSLPIFLSPSPSLAQFLGTVLRLLEITEFFFCYNWQVRSYCKLSSGFANTCKDRTAEFLTVILFPFSSSQASWTAWSCLLPLSCWGSSCQCAQHLGSARCSVWTGVWSQPCQPSVLMQAVGTAHCCSPAPLGAPSCPILFCAGTPHDSKYPGDGRVGEEASFAKYTGALQVWVKGVSLDANERCMSSP